MRLPKLPVVTLCLAALSHCPVQADQPYNWRSVEIVGGGFVSGVMFHPKQRDVVYARTDIGGAYRFDPDTRRWIPLNDQFGDKDWNFYGIESLALDPNDANRVYLAVGTYPNEWAGNGAILRSTDRGRTWGRADLPFKNGGNWGGRSMGERLAVDPQHPGTLFFGSRNNGLWASRDFGTTWADVPTFPQLSSGDDETKDIGISVVTFGPGNVLYAGVADRKTNLYRSSDGGATWQEVPGQPRGMLPHHAVFDRSGTLYLSYADNPGPNGMTDGAVWKMDGATGAWTDITPLRPKQNGEGAFGYAGLALDAAQPGTLMVATMDRWSAGDDLFRSTDGGATWKSVKSQSVNDAAASPYLAGNNGQADFGHWIGDVEIDPFNPNHALYVTGATIWGTDNLLQVDAGQKATWTPRAQGLEETAVTDLISPPSGPPLHSALGDIGGFRHDDLTASPTGGMRRNPTFNTTNSLDFAEKNPDILVRSGSGGKQKASYSLDGGLTWMPMDAEPPGTTAPGIIRVSPDGQTFAWSPGGTAPHISRDRGASWTPAVGLKPGMTIVPDREDSSLFYAFDKASETLLASRDGGKHFAPRATNLPTVVAKMRAVPGRAGDVWLALGDGGFYYSTNGGATFAKMASVQNAGAFGFGKAAPGRDYPAIYLTGQIGAVHGVFRSDDEGQNWVRINDDQHQYGYIGSNVIGDPRVYGRVYLGTNGRGILVGDPVAAG